ncbi:MAG: ATP-dependent helicase/nuclease subunit B [Candidatus Krumholzibacteriia bacterium]|jgi:ATP-dependent helicase/nuclease subunit B
MTPPEIRHIPFAADTLAVLAADLLSDLPLAAGGDLSSALVLLPSSRACRSLGQTLLDVSGRETLLLPRLQTVNQWSGEWSVALGIAPDNGPDERLRPLILAPSLAAMPWLAENPESAPGLASEFIKLFDEARLANRADLLLDPAGLDELLGLAGQAEADVLMQDMSRVHDAWRIYRQLVPEDIVDQQLKLAAAISGPILPLLNPPSLVIVAGFSRIDPMRATLLRGALATGLAGRVYLPEVKEHLARLFLTTWGAEPSPTDPLAPTRQVMKMLADEAPDLASPGFPSPDLVIPDAAAPSLRRRLDALNQEQDPASFLSPAGPLSFHPCGGPETESQLVADQVARVLAGPEGGDKRVTVAVSDPKLAARIRANLKHAGIDVDDTHGDPLSTLPAGLLLRFVLRAALTDLRIEPLLEVLAHPYVVMTNEEGHHSRWAMRLEQMYRHAKGPRGGLSALHRRADERDEAVLKLFREYRPDSGVGMVAFVNEIADAFAPLLPFGDNKTHPWRDLVAAVRATWQALVPDEMLADTAQSRPDVQKLHNLLQQIESDDAYLPATTLADFSSDLGRLLTGEDVAAHRKTFLPVVISGLVEARMERSDVLIIAGLRDGVFPKKSSRPLFLTGSLRDRLGLPGWTSALARDAELFTRLLHGAPQVMLTWSIEEDGAPTLPSSFVSRLELVLQPDLETSSPVQQWRTNPIPWAQILKSEQAFAAAPAARSMTVPIRPLTRLSWSALRTWRDCPYRFVLERGFALRPEDEVRAEFQAMDYGNVVHTVLQEWLEATSDGYAALAAGDEAASLSALESTALSHFEDGAAELPQRRLWLESLRAAMPGIVKFEISRFRNWRPVALEKEFSLALPALQTWVEQLASRLAIDLELPPLGPVGAQVVLRGVVDRVDLSQEGSGSLAVIDYKTGQTPSVKKVAELEELQILLYAAAVEMGELELPVAAAQVTEGFYYATGADQPGSPRKMHLPGDEEGRELLVRGAAQLIKLAVAAAEPTGTFPLLPRESDGTAPSTLPCGYCQFRGVCRVEEQPMRPETERKLDNLVNRKE